MLLSEKIERMVEVVMMVVVVIIIRIVFPFPWMTTTKQSFIKMVNEFVFLFLSWVKTFEIVHDFVGQPAEILPFFTSPLLNDYLLKKFNVAVGESEPEIVPDCAGQISDANLNKNNIKSNTLNYENIHL